MSDERGFTGIWIPVELWSSTEITKQEVLFLAEIDALSRTGPCFASDQYLAEFFDLSERRVKSVLKSLSDKGWIFRDTKVTNYGKKRMMTVNKAKYYNVVQQGSESALAQGSETTSGKGHKVPLYNKEDNKELYKDNSSSFDDVCAEAFETYWCAGMKKVGKKPALAKFKSYAKNNKLDPVDFAGKLFIDVQARLKSGQRGFAEMHPTTYFNQERWSDEISSGNRQSGNSQHQGDKHAERQAKLDEWERQMLSGSSQQCQDVLGPHDGDIRGQVEQGSRGYAADRPALSLDDSHWQAGEK